MTKIPMADDTVPDKLQCNSSFLPMQYQKFKYYKFLWKCLKCGKQYLISKNMDDAMEESWSPPR